jgi:hypothetical protein
LRDVFSINIFITSTKITALAEVSSAQSLAQKYLSVMPMCPHLCPAQWIQQESIVCVLNINVPHTSTKIIALAEMS